MYCLFSSPVSKGLTFQCFLQCLQASKKELVSCGIHHTTFLLQQKKRMREREGVTRGDIKGNDKSGSLSVFSTPHEIWAPSLTIAWRTTLLVSCHVREALCLAWSFSRSAFIRPCFSASESTSPQQAQHLATYSFMSISCTGGL